MDIQINFAEYFQEMSTSAQAEFAGLLSLHGGVLEAVRLNNAMWLSNLDEFEREQVEAICSVALLH